MNIATPDNRNDGFQVFRKACQEMAHATTVRDAAKRLDLLICLPELIDVGPYQPGEELQTLDILVARLGVPEATLRNIYSHGFAYSAHALGTAAAVVQLGALAQNSFALCEIFDHIRFAYDISEDWIDRFLLVGRLPELRVFDLTLGRPVVLGACGEPPPWPSPFTAKVQGSTLRVELCGLNEFIGRKARCGLFPPGSDKAFTRRSLPEALTRNSPEELAGASIHREIWEKVAVGSEDWETLREDLDAWSAAPINRGAWDSLKNAVSDAPVYEFRVRGDQETVPLGPIPSRQSLAHSVLVLAVE
jgi:hypothetical protein